MDVKKVRDLIKNGNAHMQVPPEFQAQLFGLNSKAILAGSKGLDIGCGNGSLVKYFRKRGADFEGIDKESPLEPYFINSNITGMKPMLGAIPRPDNSYDLVVSFQNIMLNRAFTFGGLLRDPSKNGGTKSDFEDHEARVRCGQYIFYEGARVIKPGGKFLIYPDASRLEEVIGRGMLSLQGISFHSEEVPRKVAEEYMEWELEHYGLNEDMKRNFRTEEYFATWGLYNRTVVTKKA